MKHPVRPLPVLAGVSLTPTLFSAILAIWVGLATAGFTWET